MFYYLYQIILNFISVFSTIIFSFSFRSCFFVWWVIFIIRNMDTLILCSGSYLNLLFYLATSLKGSRGAMASFLLGRCRSPDSLFCLCWHLKVGFLLTARQDWGFWLLIRPPPILPGRQGMSISLLSSPSLHWCHSGRGSLITPEWWSNLISPQGFLSYHHSGERMSILL